MKSDLRAPVIRLLTDPEAAVALDLTASEIDRIVEVGELRAVHVSARGGRRFWPADVAAAASVPTEATNGPAAISAKADRPSVMSSHDLPFPPHRVKRQVPIESTRARWQPYEAAVERASPTYLSFRDVEHVTGYLRARSTLDLAVEPVG